jgi:hypothetical protein
MKNTMLLAVPAPGIQPQMESGIRLLPIWTLLPLVFFWFELKLLFTATFAAVVPERLKYDSNHFMIALDSGESCFATPAKAKSRRRLVR